MSEHVKLTYGSTDGEIRPSSLQEVGRPLQMTMQGLTADKQYFAYAELYDGLQLVSQSLQETFRTLSAGVITLTHVSDTRLGSSYIINYTVSSTYALSSTVMSINGTNIQGQISGNTISFVVSGLTMGQTYPYNISTIDIYTETEATSGSLTTIAQNYINITYASRTSSSVTFDLDYISDGGFFQGFLECWASTDDPETDQPYAHVFFQDGADTVTQTNLEENTEYKFRATIEQTMGGTEIYSSVVTQSTKAHSFADDYFTVTNEYAGSNVAKLYNYRTSAVTVEVSSDGGSTWNSVKATTAGATLATIPQGGSIIVKHTGAMNKNFIICENSYSVSGNIGSLIYGDNFASGSNMPDDAYFGLFKKDSAFAAYNTTLVDASNLVMPETTLGIDAYREMFNGCTALVTPPSELPATNLSNFCYTGMFNGCSSLTSAPTFRANVLGEGCCNAMFNGCSSLTTADITLSGSCGKNSLYSMFNSCSSLTEGIKLNGITSIGQTGMCIMYSNCTSLSVAYAPTPSSWETSKMQNWLSIVAASGTLFADPSIASSIPTSASGVPSGWVINVPDAQSTDYFTITNQTNATNTISAVWQNSYGGSAQTFEVSTDGTNWSQVTATTEGATLATLPAYGSVKVRHTGIMNNNCFRATGSYSVGGNIASLDLGSAYNVTGRTMPSNQFLMAFMNDTTLVNASNLNFASYSGANASGCNQMFQGCTSLVLPPDLSPIENHYGNQVFDMMFRGCTSLVKGTNLTKLKTYGWRAIFGMYGGCTALKELYYPDFQITNGEWWSIYGDFVDRTLGGNAYATQDTYDNITSGDSSQNGWDYVCPSQWTLNVL